MKTSKSIFFLKTLLTAAVAYGSLIAPLSANDQETPITPGSAHELELLGISCPSIDAIRKAYTEGSSEPKGNLLSNIMPIDTVNRHFAISEKAVRFNFEKGEFQESIPLVPPEPPQFNISDNIIKEVFQGEVEERKPPQLTVMSRADMRKQVHLYCGYTYTVRNPAGQPIRNVPVGLIITPTGKERYPYSYTRYDHQETTYGTIILVAEELN